MPTALILTLRPAEAASVPLNLARAAHAARGSNCEAALIRAERATHLTTFRRDR